MGFIGQWQGKREGRGGHLRVGGDWSEWSWKEKSSPGAWCRVGARSILGDSCLP